jgi:hypothetical protein
MKRVSSAKIETLTYLGSNVLLAGQKCILHAAQRHNSGYKVRGSAVTVVRSSPMLLELLGVGPMVLMPRRHQGDYDICLGNALHVLLRAVAPSHRIDVLAVVLPSSSRTRDLLCAFDQWGWGFLRLLAEERRSLVRQVTEGLHTIRINGIPLHRYLALSDRRFAAAIGRTPSTVSSHRKNSERPAPARTRPPRGGQPSAARGRQRKSSKIPIATKGRQLALFDLKV